MDFGRAAYDLAVKNKSFVNLLDQTKIVDGVYNLGASTSANAAYFTGDYIAAKPNTSYVLGWARRCCFYDSSKSYLSAYEPDSSSHTNLLVTTPANTAFIRYSGHQTGRTNTMMVTEGTDIPSSYTPFFGSSSGTATVTNQITLSNADRIGAPDDSISDGNADVLKGKAWPSKVSELSDYNFENFSLPGSTYASSLKRIRDNTPRYHSTLGWKDYNCTYAILNMHTNDLRNGLIDNIQQYENDIRAMIETIKELGAVPILTTVYDDFGYTGFQNSLLQISKEYNAYYMPILPKAKATKGTNYAGFWDGSHAGTRTQHLNIDNYVKYLQQLPRPLQSLKIFRKKPSVTVGTVDDLLFSSNRERAKLFTEIAIGHLALGSVAEKYYDQLNVKTTDQQLVTSEYLKLMNKEAVSFSDYAVIDAILPTTANNIDALNLYLTDNTVNVYIKDSLVSPYPDPTYYQMFTITDPLGTTAVGDVYSSGGQNYTVQIIQGSNLYCTPLVYTINNTSGTLTKVSGLGPATLAFSTTHGQYGPSYPTVKQQVGHWTQVTFNSTTSRFELTPAQLKRAMDYDKLSILLYKSGGFSLSDSPKVEWTGRQGKDRNYSVRIIKEPKGSELLTQTSTGTTAELTGWTTTGTVTPMTPTDSCVPQGTTGCIQLTPSNSISQALTLQTISGQDVEVSLRITGRYYPAIFDGSTQTFPAQSLINYDSYDYADIIIEVTVNSKKFYLTDSFGLHWNEVTFPIVIPSDATSMSVKVYAKDLTVQVAKVSAKVLN